MSNQRSNQALTLLAGAGIGAALMYFLDPDRGTRRRHLVADQATSMLRTRKRDAAQAMRDVRNRARGMVAHTRGRFGAAEPTDEQLVARVRAELGRHVERARPIEVTVERGLVTLQGEIADTEYHEAITAVRRVPGVRRVDNQMAIFAADRSGALH